MLERLGTADALRISERPDPVPVAGEVLVRIRAASVNPVDWKIATGKLKLIFPVVMPWIPGCDFSGEVVAVASKEGPFRVGDRVIGMVPPNRGGGWAELMAAPVSCLAPMPPAMDWEEAAGLPLAGLTALQSLRTLGRLQEGESVLINGAAGGVGCLALQLAQALGGRAWAVARAEQADRLHDLGAAEVWDYREGPVWRRPEFFHLVFDAAATLPALRGLRLLVRGGRFITTLPSPTYPFGKIVARLRGGYLRVVRAAPVAEDFDFLARLVEAGRLRVPVERVYPLEETVEAQRQNRAGGGFGKIIVRMDC